MMEILERAKKEHAAGVDFVMITVVETSGSVPASLGSRMLVMQNEIVGTVGGGALEKDAVERARAMLTGSGEAQLIHKNVSELDMSCGGDVTLFFEPFRSAMPLWIFGGGHVAEALVPLAASVGFNVTVIDNRPEFADPKRFPDAARTICSPYLEAAHSAPASAFAVIVTHGHSHDEEVLKELVSIAPPLPYIGMIGSKKKVPIVFDNLRADGIEPGDNVYAPIGIELGGGSPAEIAISIAAELLSVKNDKKGLPHCRGRLVRR